MAASFQDYPLRLLQPAFDAPLTDVVIELDYLRRHQLAGDTPAPIFFQLKDIFHFLESLGSARIEGNHTTLADYVEAKIDEPTNPNEQFQEIQNIEKAMDYVELAIMAGGDISEALIRELHQLAVEGLQREGDKTPGKYRAGNVTINGAQHQPPSPALVPQYMEELTAFINRADAPKYDLLKMALAHHRFCWIHPFSNGNGRTVRLLSYAMLIKFGFNVSTGGRVLNPTAVFCNDRNAYYANLAAADEGKDAGLEAWCLYVLGGIRDELKKLDRLLDYTYLRQEILVPALTLSIDRKWVTPEEAALLQRGIAAGEFKANDLGPATRQRTHLIQKLLKNKMIRPLKEGGRTYSISFTNNYLLRGVVKALEDKGFIPPLVKAG
jgi:Fic family protein